LGGSVNVIANAQISADVSSGLTFTNANPLSSVTNANVTLTGGGAITFGGNVNLGTGTLTNSLTGTGAVTFLSNNSTMTVYNPIAGTGVISILAYQQSNGLYTGTVALPANNSGYTGNINVNAGVLAISTNYALGAGGGSALTTISGNFYNPAELDLSGSISSPENFILDGKQPTNVNPAIRNVTGNNTLTGNISAAGGGNQYDIDSDAGLLTVSGNITIGSATGGRYLNFMGAGNGLLSGAINASGSNYYIVTKMGTGTWTFSSSNTYTGGTFVNAGKLILASAGAFPANTLLNVSSGATVQVAQSSGNSSYVPTLSALNNSGIIDLTNNAMIVHNGNFNALWGEVQAGYNGGSWTVAPGTSGAILSSTAAADTTHLTALGIATNLSSFQGAGGSYSVASTDVVIKDTYYGDALLTGSVTSADYTQIDNGYLRGLTGWQNGDFNYDGTVNGSDYTLIDNAFNLQGGNIAAEVAVPTAQIAGGSATSSSVPEPASLGLLGIGALGLLGRRSRRDR
jgi:autotransporter-associated beta strand protein